MKSKPIFLMFFLMILSLSVFISAVCTDSDDSAFLGINPYVKGTSAGCFSNGTCGTFADYCLDSKTLMDYACVRTETSEILNEVQSNCPFDTDCENGVCEDKFICVDSEGGINDYYSKGNISVYKSSAPSTRVGVIDICLADVSPSLAELFVVLEMISSEQKENKNLLFESKCITPIPSDTIVIEGNTVNSNLNPLTEVYICPNGCKDGVCIKIEEGGEEIEDEKQIQEEDTVTNNQEEIEMPKLKFYISNKEVNIEGNVIEVEGKFIESFLDITEESSKIYVEVSSGDKEIKILPEEAISKADKIENVNEIIIGQEEGEAVYVISGTKKARLFFIFPITADVEQKINVENGNLVSINKPWWSFLALGI